MDSTRWNAIFTNVIIRKSMLPICYIPIIVWIFYVDRQQYWKCDWTINIRSNAHSKRTVSTKETQVTDFKVKHPVTSDRQRGNGLVFKSLFIHSSLINKYYILLRLNTYFSLTLVLHFRIDVVLTLSNYRIPMFCVTIKYIYTVDIQLPIIKRIGEFRNVLSYWIERHFNIHQLCFTKSIQISSLFTQVIAIEWNVLRSKSII